MKTLEKQAREMHEVHEWCEEKNYKHGCLRQFMHEYDSSREDLLLREEIAHKRGHIACQKTIYGILQLYTHDRRLLINELWGNTDGTDCTDTAKG